MFLKGEWPITDDLEEEKHLVVNENSTFTNNKKLRKIPLHKYLKISLHILAFQYIPSNLHSFLKKKIFSLRTMYGPHLLADMSAKNVSILRLP